MNYHIERGINCCFCCGEKRKHLYTLRTNIILCAITMVHKRRINKNDTNNTNHKKDSKKIKRQTKVISPLYPCINQGHNGITRRNKCKRRCNS